MMLIRSISLEKYDSFPEIEYDCFSLPGSENHLKASQVSLIYAPNGSGKTTFSRRIGKQFLDGSGTCLTDVSNSKISIPNLSARIPLFVFNEDFIDTKIRIRDREKNGHLEALVMFDKQIVDEDHLEELQSELDRLQVAESEKRQRVRELDQENGEIDKAKRVLKQELQKPDGWAEQIQKAKAAGRKESVNEEVYANFLKLLKEDEQPKDSDVGELSQLVKERESLIEKLTGTQESVPIEVEIERFVFPDSTYILRDLLAEVPEITVKGEIANFYAERMQGQLGQRAFELAKLAFHTGQQDVCPACTQRVNEDLQIGISQAIQEILGSASLEQLEDKLKQTTVPQFPKAEIFARLDTISADFLAAETVKKTADTLAEDWNAFIKLKSEKINNLGTSFEFDLSTLEKSRDKFNAAVLDFNREVQEYNGACADRVKDIEKVRDLSYKISLSDAETAKKIKALKALVEESDQLALSLPELQAKVTLKKDRIVKHKARAKKTTIAAELINSYLRAIFAEKDRLSLEPVESAYRVNVRGETVPAALLSTGERNILALAYFFASVFESGDDYNSYKEQRLIVLDDPMSSFDSDNKLGVFTFLRQIMRNFLLNNSTQIVVLSHDIEIIRQFDAVFRTINGIKAVTKTIEFGKVVDINLDSFAVYRNLLKKTYEYACGINEAERGESVPTGNELRLILEAFATFELGCGISEILQKPAVKSALRDGSEALQKYFDGPLYKLVLHGESHMEESIHSGILEITPSVAERERRILCRELICLIDYIAPAHIPSHLGISDKQNQRYGNILEFRERVNEWGASAESRSLLILNE